MAQRKQDFLGNVIGRITELPGAKGLIDSVQSLGERLDDMQKRVRGLEKMEKRLADLERRVKTLEGGRAAGVEAIYHDPDSGRTTKVTVRAPQVVVAGGSLESPALLLRSHGRAVEIGTFLGAGERRQFAEQLQTVLTRWRTT